jgi:hypothetical protein
VSGILGQRLGARLRLIIVGGSFLVLLSCVYLLRLTTASGYLDGVLPAFLLRGLGIGLVMAASSFAVVSAAPLAKSGLASGTLTMARNLGTALGVALFGSVYLQSVATQLRSQLAGLPPEQFAVVATAAEHFALAGPDATHAVVAQIVLDGFIHVALAGVVVTAVAMISAVFIRPRVPVTQAATMRPDVVASVVEP